MSKLRKAEKAENWSQMKDQLGGPTENWNPCLIEPGGPLVVSAQVSEEGTHNLG